MYRQHSDKSLAEPEFQHDLQANGLKVKGDGRIRTARGTFIDARLQFTERLHDLHLEAIQGGVRKYVAEVCTEHYVKPVYACGQNGTRMLKALPEENEPAVPILTSKLTKLKRKPTVIIIVGEHTEDLGVFSHYEALHEAGIFKATILGLISELSKWKNRKDVVETDLKMSHKDAPGLIVLNPGQLIYSHKDRRNYTHRSWLNRSQETTEAEDYTIDRSQNLVEGHKNATEHVKTFFEHLLNKLVSDHATLCIIGIGDGASNVLSVIDNMLIVNPKHDIGKRLALTFLIQPTHDHDSLRSTQLKDHLRVYGQSFVLSDKPIFSLIQGPTIVHVESKQLQKVSSHDMLLPPRSPRIAIPKRMLPSLRRETSVSQPSSLEDHPATQKRRAMSRRVEEAARGPRLKRRHRTVPSPVIDKPAPYTVDSSPENMADNMSLTSAEKVPLRDRPRISPPHPQVPPELLQFPLHLQHTSQHYEDPERYPANVVEHPDGHLPNEIRDRVTGWIMAGPAYTDLRALGIETFVSDFDDLNHADHGKQTDDPGNLNSDDSSTDQGLSLPFRPKAPRAPAVIEAGPSSSTKELDAVAGDAGPSTGIETVRPSSTAEERTLVPATDEATTAVGSFSEGFWPVSTFYEGWKPVELIGSQSDENPYDYTKEKVSCATMSAGPDVQHVNSILPAVMPFILNIIHDWSTSDFEHAVVD